MSLYIIWHQNEQASVVRFSIGVVTGWNGVISYGWSLTVFWSRVGREFTSPAWYGPPQSHSKIPQNSGNHRWCPSYFTDLIGFSVSNSVGIPWNRSRVPENKSKVESLTNLRLKLDEGFQGRIWNESRTGSLESRKEASTPAGLDRAFPIERFSKLLWHLKLPKRRPRLLYLRNTFRPLFSTIGTGNWS